MHTVLIVANQTLGGQELRTVVEAKAAEQACRFRVLVPATRLSDLHRTAGIDGDAQSWVKDVVNDDGAAAAETRLHRALDQLRAAGIEATGEIGDPDALQAIHDAVRTDAVHEIVLATLPPGISRWLGQDLVHKVERRFGVPVTHVVGKPSDQGVTSGS